MVVRWWMVVAIVASHTVVTHAASLSANVTVYHDASTDQYTCKVGVMDRSGAAVANFDDTLNVTGWGVLNIKTSGHHADAVQAHAAGYAEGYLTAARIYEHYRNMYATTFHGKHPTPELRKFMNDQDAWSRQQVKANPEDLYWQQVGNIIAQYDGLVGGYAAAVTAQYAAVPALDNFAFQMLNGIGDLFQIIPAVNPNERLDWESLTVNDAERQLNRMGHCSGLVKVTGNFSDLFMGHSSWFTYSATNRIFKHYHFSYSNPTTAAQRVTFSSYPGFLESLDDFYMMSSGVGMVQTSISFSNNSLYKLIKPQALLAWQRVRLAAAMAKTAEEWYTVYKQHYSGTYCNQYMVVNFNLFTPGEELKPGTLWVVEEIPGSIPGQDMTDTLARGYWPSYNVPYFQNVQHTSGFHRLADRGVPSAQYQLAPRAKIFRRDEGDVVDFKSYKHIMRYNEWQTDPYAHKSAVNAICARGDLPSGEPGGCYDTKVTNYQRFKKMQCDAINGPTYQDQPVYKWSQFPNAPHLGLPAEYNFPFVTMEPLDL